MAAATAAARRSSSASGEDGYDERIVRLHHRLLHPRLHTPTSSAHPAPGEAAAGARGARACAEGPAARTAAVSGDAGPPAHPRREGQWVGMRRVVRWPCASCGARVCCMCARASRRRCARVEPMGLGLGGWAERERGGRAGRLRAARGRCARAREREARPREKKDARGERTVTVEHRAARFVASSVLLLVACRSAPRRADRWESAAPRHWRNGRLAVRPIRCM